MSILDTVEFKYDVCSIFVAFYQFMFIHFSISIPTLRSDARGEYIGKMFQFFLVDKGITHQTCLHFPGKNDFVERKHHHVLKHLVPFYKHLICMSLSSPLLV